MTGLSTIGRTRSRFSRQAEARSKLRVVVRGDAACPPVEIQRVMNLIGEAGIADISFAASNK